MTSVYLDVAFLCICLSYVYLDIAFLCICLFVYLGKLDCDWILLIQSYRLLLESRILHLANNGYKFDGYNCVKYDELQADDPKLLQAFLDSVEDSPEADDASIA